MFAGVYASHLKANVIGVSTIPFRWKFLKCFNGLPDALALTLSLMDIKFKRKLFQFVFRFVAFCNPKQDRANRENDSAAKKKTEPSVETIGNKHEQQNERAIDQA